MLYTLFVYEGVDGCKVIEFTDLVSMLMVRRDLEIEGVSCSLHNSAK